MCTGVLRDHALTPHPAASLNRGKRLFNRARYIIGLAPFIPLMRKIARAALRQYRSLAELVPGGLAGHGTMEVEFASGARMRITGAVDAAMVTAAVAALARMGARR